jgi:glycosyltransferase involved in cell wall biosynthesis
MTAADRLPVVTIVVPMLDELGFIEACLEGFAAQSYDTDLLDVVVVDGGSTDGSRGVVERFADHHPWVRIVDNPARKASAAFNVGVDAAKGEVVCLFSAHGVPGVDYVRASVTALLESGAAGVGGRYLHVGLDPVSSAVGLAMVSPFGMASPHRSATTAQAVDTISHPAYWRQALLDVGPFDESLARNSDYELNWRLRERGQTLWFDPSIESVYRPRGSLQALARQFWWYGRWKVRVARRHPRSLRPRHLVAPAAVVGVALSPLLLRRPLGRKAVAAAGVAYAGLCAEAVRRAHPRDHGASAVALAACFPIMHGSWGGGFVASVVEDTTKAAR